MILPLVLAFQSDCYFPSFPSAPFIICALCAGLFHNYFEETPEKLLSENVHVERVRNRPYLYFSSRGSGWEGDNKKDEKKLDGTERKAGAQLLNK